MRLIDADALIDMLGVSDTDIEIQELLNEAPTIDAVPVIRCKDCRFYKTHYWNEEFRLCDFGMPPREDGFCSWAWTGRKEE